MGANGTGKPSAQPGSGRPAVEDLSYTEASRELDAIVAYFEQREIDVDQLVGRLERATAIVGELDKRLRRTRVQVEQLVPRLAAVLTDDDTDDDTDEDLPDEATAHDPPSNAAAPRLTGTGTVTGTVDVTGSDDSSSAADRGNNGDGDDASEVVPEAVTEVAGVADAGARTRPRRRPTGGAEEGSAADDAPGLF